MQFPDYRPRRMRRTVGLRRMIRETSLDIGSLIYPIFVVPGTKIRQEISSMPGQYHYSVDQMADLSKEIYDLKIPAVILFGIPQNKDSVGSEAWNDNGVIQKAIRTIKKHTPELVVIADACFCEYTDHGHCGVLDNGYLNNDASLENLIRTSLSYAKAGVDIIAPSGMLDGFVAECRSALDENNYTQVAIMAYSAKYASAYYGPFRDAAMSTPHEGDRKGYQMDSANVNEAIREITLDTAEGADIVMVKPALAYLDVIRVVSEESDLPVAAYNVSGEYAALRAAADRGWLDYDRVVDETLLSIRRAGADMILTYHAKEFAKRMDR